MAKKEISFSLVLPKNLGLPNTQLEQIEAVVVVTGSTDPLTLQKMRDVAEPYFKAKRTGLNNLIETREKEIAGASTKKQFATRVSGFHKLMDERLTTIEKDLQKTLAEFCKKDKEMGALYAKNKKLFAVETAWSSAKVVNASMKAFDEGVAGALTGGLNVETLKAAKTCFDLASDLLGLAQEVKAYYTSEEKQRKIYKAALLKIMVIKKEDPIPSSLIKGLEDAIKPYPQKLRDIEMNSKSVAKKLDKLLKASPPLAKVDDAIVKAQAMKGSRTIKAAIKDVTQAHVRVQSGKEFLKYTMTKLVEAKTREKDDQGWLAWGWEWAKSINESYNDYDTITGDPGNPIEEMDQMRTAYEKCSEAMEKLASRD
ncbi:MAG: hypothetical protein ACI89L_001525 [Phycisphaerales bacterium]|jgi:hypothetical protein